MFRPTVPWHFRGQEKEEKDQKMVTLLPRFDDLETHYLLWIAFKRANVLETLALLNFTQRLKISSKYHKDTFSFLEFLKVIRRNTRATLEFQYLNLIVNNYCCVRRCICNWILIKDWFLMWQWNRENCMKNWKCFA